MRFLALFVVTLCSSCGPTTFKEFCKHSAAAACRAQFRCDEDAARSVWPNIQDCTNDIAQRADCATAVGDDCTLLGDASSLCIDAIDNMTCGDSFIFPDACRDVRCVGKTACRGSSSSSMGSGCKRERTECTNGKSYAITCTDTSCTCSENGVDGKTFEPVGYCDASSETQNAAFAQSCGFAF